MLRIELVEEYLTTRELGRNITYYPFTDSTNDDMWELLDQGGATGGHVVVTDEQRHGKGRQGRPWFSAAGLALPFSVLLLPDLRLKQLGLLSLAAGVAVVRALHESRVAVQLKWPNDIVAGELKVGGILTETRLVDEGPIAVQGIGLNVNELAEDLAPEISDTAVSARMLSGSEIERELLLARTLGHLENILDNEIEIITDEWMKSCAHIGYTVCLTVEGQEVKGKFTGVTEDGYGLIAADGETHTVMAGDIRWCN
ncbi:MAG: biotin--[acetyl-CoA-carboxylase] ligase [Candidatus Marinimicrobia bacterium]|nr:biotin--[acetyl-CoA-carboxylase] ligase [Candidatus Neomarinimicrobiota bacterium]